MTHDQAEGLAGAFRTFKEDGVEKDPTARAPNPETTIRMGAWNSYFEVDDEKPRNLPTKKPYKPTRKG